MEKLIIAGTPFEFSDIFFEQVYTLQTLSFINVSHTNIDFEQFLSKIPVHCSKLLIKACPITSHMDVHLLSSKLSSLTESQQITLKIPQKLKDELLICSYLYKKFLE